MQDVETVTATVDLDEVLAYRASMASLQEQASAATRIPCVDVDFALCGEATAFLPMQLSQPKFGRRCARLVRASFPFCACAAHCTGGFCRWRSSWTAPQPLCCAPWCRASRRSHP